MDGLTTFHGHDQVFKRFKSNHVVGQSEILFAYRRKQSFPRAGGPISERDDGAAILIHFLFLHFGLNNIYY